MTPFIDEVKYNAALETVRRKDKYIQLAALAEQGEVQAASVFGEALLKGVWDEDDMLDDINKGRYFHPPQNSDEQDHYLIFKRNPIRAVSLLKIAADYDAGYGLPELHRARSLLAFMQSKGLAGFKSGGEVTYGNPSLLSPSDMKMLRENARNSAEGSEDLEFVPVPDVRPSLEHPSANRFQEIATCASKRCFYQALISFITGSFILIANNGSHSYALICVIFQIFYTALLCEFGYLFYIYGVQKKLPTCSCPQMQESYKSAAQKLPHYWEKYADPFESTPKPIRNLLKIKQYTFWTYILIAFIVITVTGIYIPRGLPRYYGLAIISACVLGLINSIVIIVWDKRFPVIVSRLMAVIVLFVAFFPCLFVDKDCEWESFKNDVEEAETPTENSQPEQNNTSLKPPHSYPKNVVSPFGKAAQHRSPLKK